LEESKASMPDASTLCCTIVGLARHDAQLRRPKFSPGTSS
jgi:hypothetical protein